MWRSLGRRIAALICHSKDCLHDVVVAGAAAEVAGEHLAHLRLARARVFLEVRLEGHDDAGGAEAALQPVHLVQRLLQGRELSVLRHRLDGGDLVALHLHRVDEAGARGLAVDEHRAGAAHAVLAADMRSGEPAVLAQHVGEELPRLCANRVALSIYVQFEFKHLTTARFTRTSTSSFLYRAGTRGFSAGSTASRAFLAMVSGFSFRNSRTSGLSSAPPMPTLSLFE